MKPNVRAKGAPTAGHQAPACENARVPQAGAWWPAVGAPLERGVRQHIFATAARAPFICITPFWRATRQSATAATSQRSCEYAKELQTSPKYSRTNSRTFAAAETLRFLQILCPRFVVILWPAYYFGSSQFQSPPRNISIFPFSNVSVLFPRRTHVFANWPDRSDYLRSHAGAGLGEMLYSAVWPRPLLSATSRPRPCAA